MHVASISVRLCVGDLWLWGRLGATFIDHTTQWRSTWDLSLIPHAIDKHTAIVSQLIELNDYIGRWTIITAGQIWLTAMQVLRHASHFNPIAESCISAPSTSRDRWLISIQVPKFLSQFHPAPRLPSQFHPSHISPPSRSQELESHHHPCPKICVSNLSRSCLRSIHGWVYLTPYRSHLASI